MEVDDLFPATGPISGGSVVTVTGSNFLSVTTCYFGTSPGGAVTVQTSTQLLCVSASQTGAGDLFVSVTNNGVNAGPSCRAFKYYGMLPSAVFCPVTLASCFVIV